MKKISLLKKIALGSGVLASVTPIMLMSTSCAIEDITADYIEFNDVKFNHDYTKASTSSTSFKRLLFGSKKVYDGNYVLFIGSNMFATTCKFYSGNPSLRERDQWFKTSEQSESGHFWDGDFFLGIEMASESINNFGIFNAIDFWDGKVYDNKGHEIVVCEKPDSPTQVIGPWTKWNSSMITQTKLYNKTKGYEWDEKSVTADKDYIRNDSSAVAYREFIQTALKVYPVNDKRKKSFELSDNKSYMLIFKDGKLQSQGKDEKELVDILDMPTTRQTWHETIVKYFKVKEESK